MQMIMIGTDAGYWIIGPDGKPRHVEGWGVEQLREVRAALTIIQQATQLKTPGLAESAIRSVHSFAEKQLGEHVKGDAIVVIGM